MIEVRSKTFEWDYKEPGPDWNKVNEWIGQLECRPYFYRVDIDNDGYAIVVADRKLLQEEAELLYES